MHIAKIRTANGTQQMTYTVSDYRQAGNLKSLAEKLVEKYGLEGYVCHVTFITIRRTPKFKVKDGVAERE